MIGQHKREVDKVLASCLNAQRKMQQQSTEFKKTEARKTLNTSAVVLQWP
jgi:hypothetical protein